MKLAILGTDSDVLHLVAAARDLQHQLVWLGDIRADDASAIARFDTGLSVRAGEWELLLDRGFADAVLIGRGTAPDELRLERIKRLVAEGVPVLVVHPAFESVLPFYEIDMVRRESLAIVQHYNPLDGHPFTPEVASWLRDGHPELGKIHQLSCECRVAVAERDKVLVHFARDAELLAAIAGDIRRVTAIGPTGTASSFASLQIQMITAAAPSLRWSVGYAPSGSARLDLTLLGETGVATIRISDDIDTYPAAWKLETVADGVHTNLELEPFDPARAAIVRLSDAVSQSQTDRRSAASTWETATRAMEVVDAAELSLQKGRTIEVYQQHLTERLAFRGTMAAIGCGLLLIAFMAIVAVAMLGGAEGIIKQRLAPRNSWPLVLLAILAFFLLLQAVPLLAAKSKRRNGDGTPSQQP